MPGSLEIIWFQSSIYSNIGRVHAQDQKLSVIQGSRLDFSYDPA